MILIVVALGFGEMAQSIRTLVPMPFFGVLLLYVGVQHVALAANVERQSDLLFVGLTGALAAVFDGNLAYAAAITLACYWAVQGLQFVRARALA